MKKSTAGRKPAEEVARENSVQVRLTDAEKSTWIDAAAAEGRDLSNWIRWVCSTAIGRRKGKS